ncbi:hypothetical protein ACIGEO_18620 [Stenotrophomonas bentonitica]
MDISPYVVPVAMKMTVEVPGFAVGQQRAEPQVTAVEDREDGAE